MKLCTHCGEPLHESQDRLNNSLKSCPRCSTNDGSEHIYYPSPSAFGTTDKRVTTNNPTGLQSYCQECRGNNEGPHTNGIRCSSL